MKRICGIARELRLIGNRREWLRWGNARCKKAVAEVKYRVAP